MSSVLGVITARDEIRTLSAALSVFQKNGIPYIAILDNPTKEVRWILRGALDTYEMPPCEGAHVYRWGQILHLMEWAIKRPRNYDWVWRIDADEIWPNILPEIEIAEKEKRNTIDFGIQNFSPTVQCLQDDQDFQKECKPSEFKDPLFLATRGMPYQRVWSLSDPWAFIGGGHIVQSDKQKIMTSSLIFNHYPAVDINSLDKKLNRVFLDSERKKGWHLHYDLLKKSREVKKELNSKLHVFYHVAMMSKWKEIVREQTSILCKSGILEKANVTVGYVCDEPKKDPSILNFDCKNGGSIINYEYPTLKLIWDWCQEHPEDFILYIHTKGASKPDSKHTTKWRQYLMWGCVEEWKRCVRALEEGSDMSGVEWTGQNDLFKWGCTNPEPVGFWAGNFFWARASYIKKLPDPMTLDRSIRFYAEAWSGLVTENPKIKCFYDTRDWSKGRKRGWQDSEWGRKSYAR